MDNLSKLAVHFAKKQFVSVKGAFKYYVIKEVGGWEWLNDDVIKKYARKKNFFFACAENKVVIFF